MSKIGDLWFGLRADDKTLQAEIRKSGKKGGDTFGLEMARSLKKSWSGGEIGKGLIQGLGMAGGLGAARLFSTAIAKVGDVLSDATAAALEDETSVQKLGTALKANVKGWDGNTDAIEKVLTARMKLGFSDDEQRDSLAILIARTGDYTKALAIQRVGMDLARLKGIPLAEATKAISMGMMGQGRALKELGINVAELTNTEEVLTAIQAKAAGQAEDYAKTNAGKLLVSQVKVGEAMEKLGARTMPLVVSGTVAAADAIEELTTQADELATAVGPAGVGGFLDFLGGVLAGIPTAGAGVSATANKMANDWLHAGDAVAEAAATTETATGKMADDVRKSGGAFGSFGTKVVETGRQVKETARAMATRITEWKDSIIADAAAVINGYYDPLIAADKLLAVNAEIAANQRIVNSSKDKVAVAEARTALLGLNKEREGIMTELASTGSTSSKVYRATIASLEKEFKTASGERKAAILAELAYWRTLNAQVHKVAVTIGNSGIHAGGKGGGTLRASAAGGSLAAGEPSWVGEGGGYRELFVPNVSGVVVPHTLSEAMASGGGGNTTNINITNPEPRAADADIGRMMRRLSAMGIAS